MCLLLEVNKNKNKTQLWVHANPKVLFHLKLQEQLAIPSHANGDQESKTVQM